MKQLLVREFQRAAKRGPKRSVFVSNLASGSQSPQRQRQRGLHSSSTLLVVKPYILADIGEGITECQIISWFVKPGDRVQQFDRICEVQSDKASVEITSRFDGTIKALHYEQDAMAIVGQPLLDIDIEDDPSGQGQRVSGVIDDVEGAEKEGNQMQEVEKVTDDEIQKMAGPQEPQVLQEENHEPKTPPSPSSGYQPTSNHHALVTPGVRHLLKKLNLDVAKIQGTGRDGRVRKEDIQRYQAAQASAPAFSSSPPVSKDVSADQLVSLTPTEKQMFKVMTRSSTIPHFTYTHIVDFTTLTALRKRAKSTVNSSSRHLSSGAEETYPRLTPLPFILKAVSQAFTHFPKLNAHLVLDEDGTNPKLLLKSSHDIGIAVDTPQGLLVPVVRDVQSKSIVSLAAEITRLSTLAKEGRLSVADFQGATFTVSNIGSIGGAAVSPVIVGPQVGILGVGRARVVPGFESEGKEDRIVRREEVVLSWAADHRVLDGATVARCAEMVGEWVEKIDVLAVQLK